MAKYLALISPDEVFENLKIKPILLNDLKFEMEVDRKALNELIMTTYGEDEITLDSTPSCSCGFLSGNIYLEEQCNVCNSRVEYDYSREIESNIWIKAPEGIHGIFTPVVWNILSEALMIRSGKWSGLEYLCNSNYRQPDPTNSAALAFIERAKKFGLRRGYNETIEDLDRVIDLVAEHVTNPAKAEAYKEFLLANRSKLYAKHRSIPNKIAFVIEKTAMGDYTDKSIQSAMDAIYTLVRISSETDMRRIGNRLAVACASFNEYFESILGRDWLASKSGWLRSSVYGSRIAFSFRTTITSRTDRHHYEEIQIPYPQACVLFKIHLLNVLVFSHNMSYLEAATYIEYHTAKVDPFLKGLIEKLIANTPGGMGFWATFTRYPSLSRGSTQALRITGLAEVATISILAITSPNADKSFKIRPYLWNLIIWTYPL